MQIDDEMVISMAACIGIARAALERAKKFIVQNHGDPRSKLENNISDKTLSDLLDKIDMGITGRKADD